MEDPRWLRLITIGLVIAALAVAYFLLTGRFNQSGVENIVPTAQPSVQMQITQASPSPAVSGINATQPAISTPSAISSGTGAPLNAALPRTGMALSFLLSSFCLSAIAAGFGLRKYPN